MSTLAIPIHGSKDESVVVQKDALPDDPEEIMMILASELAPLKLWLEFGVSYYQQGKIEQFVNVMEVSVGEDGPLFSEH